VLLDSKAMADTPRGLRCDSVMSSIMSMDDDADHQQGLDDVGLMLSQSFASGSMTELSSLYSMSEDVSLRACFHYGYRSSRNATQRNAQP